MRFFPWFKTANKKPHLFDIGKINRRLAALPTNTQAINSVIYKYGRTALARSRYLCLNNPYAASAKSSYMTALVGDGIMPVPTLSDENQNQIVTELWRTQAQRIDFDSVTNFGGLLSRVAAELFEAGECFLQIIRSDAGLRLKLLPSEMLPISSLQYKSGNIDLGIEFDASGQRTAYHFLKKHPGDIARDVSYYDASTVRIPAEDVLHIFNPLRAGQIRGFPQTVSALMRLAILDMYDDAELERKRTAALFSVFVTKPQPSDSDADIDNPLGGDAGSLFNKTDEVNQFLLEPGAVIDLLPGEDIKISEPTEVGGTYEAFQYRSLTAISAGLQIPYSLVTNDLRALNYSMSRAEHVKFRQRISAIQRNNFIPQVLVPVWREFIRYITATGTSPWSATEYLQDSERYSRAEYILPRWPFVDPTRDIQAEVVAIDNALKSRSDSIREAGGNPQEVDRRIKEDRKRLNANEEN